MIINKYYDEISKVLDFLDDLNLFNIDCALVYGSAYNEAMFTKNSDIIIIFLHLIYKKYVENCNQQE